MDDYGTAALMEDPDDFYPPSPPPTKQVFTMQSGRAVTLHLVGHSPTEAHHLWNGAKFISDYLEDDPAGRVRGKAVLELGAAAGLPSLAAAVLGARRVVMTDFPDPDLVANMQKNIDECDAAVEPRGSVAARVHAMGFVWGADPAPLLARLAADASSDEDAGAGTGAGTGAVPPASEAASVAVAAAAAGEEQEGHKEEQRFDVLVLADLLFRHSEHGALVKTIKETMARDGAAYVFFTSYRPWKQDLDMRFFDVARDAGLSVEQVSERKLEKPLFDNDPGDLDVQKTVKGFVVRWADDDDDAATGP
ncbi:Nicotinamide N-methyltransferase [Purpureocillium takamizusanense]|uniref:Protein N-terminal and lysine N-methyltransferase EFM7 n=1 Tax=Purpureocillium takamizusanense TaxID=2060973 RepID=A0A9Q8QNU3_9HYPO|nr:Nicotinamide N-methyltransferase [Purpureocillium takamizusanense]UNI22632.1 Nicotinamide N-methyltransferase [Purpureocillium takamizusanense]